MNDLTNLTTEPQTIPEALGNEYGDCYWIQGHVEPALALLAVVVHTMVDVGDEEARLLLVGGTGNWQTEWLRPRQLERANELLRNVEHTWLQQDADNEELMHVVAAGAEGAMPFTRVLVAG